MKIFVDIDGTICHSAGGYENATPIISAIHKINRLYEKGHEITYWTARGGNSGIDWTELTKKQLNDWGCLYHELKLDKPPYDCFIDDKALNMSDVRLGTVGGVSGIYKISSRIFPEKYYIGSAKDIVKRWNGHLYNLLKNKHHSEFLQTHYNEFGKEDLVFSILEECGIDDLIEKEGVYLKEFNPYFNIYKEPGSPKNHKFSDVARRNMSVAHLGKKQSDETKRKRSLSMMGHSVSEDTKEKLREKRKNYRHSEITRNKLRIASTDNKNALGHSVSSEARKKMSDGGKKAMKMLERDNKGRLMKKKI